MMRLFRKWWILRELRNESRRHGVEKLSLFKLELGEKHWIARYAIVDQLSKKSVHRFSWLLFWRRKDNEIKRRFRATEYSSIFREAKREELVRLAVDYTLKDENGGILNPPDVKWFYTSDLGDKYIAEFWYKVLRAIFFNAYATGILIILITTWAGIFLKNKFEEIKQVSPPTVNVYPNITSPDVYPTINIYPNKPEP